ncbi:MAG: glycosyltransferase family 39 protein [Phycisphaerales bacterium]|nr:glycosyltransferase family 39 protein [Phycisphaerales bacterium]
MDRKNAKRHTKIVAPSRSREDATATTSLQDETTLVTLETHHRQREDVNAADHGWQCHRLTRLDAVLAIAFFALALMARWPFVERGETLLHSDEAIVGLMAQDIAAGQRFPIYFYGQRYMGALEAYAIAALSPLFDNPIHALRFGPACFFALMVVVQFCMLTRWLGRRGGMVGVAVLLAASPMFMQWSISARGGYIEIMLWGSALLWAYSEWFVQKAEWRTKNEELRNRTLPRFVFGALVGSGMWINPSIVLFLAPIVVHAMLNRPLALLWESPSIGGHVERVSRSARHATLPIAALLGILLLNLTWAVWVKDHKVNSVLMLGLVPKPVAMAILGAAGAAVLFFLSKKTTLLQQARTLISRNGIMIVGILVGAGPAAFYMLQTVTGARAMDPSLPLGFRPIWLAGETLVYLVNGLPMLFNPDPRPFLQLVGVGRDTVTLPLDITTSGLVMGAGWLALGSLVSVLAAVLYSERDGLSRLFRLEPMNHSPGTLLLLGVGATLALYVMGGCTLDFTTIRYLIPLWVFVPGILAAAFVTRRFRFAAKAAPICLCIAWGTGQIAMHRQLGAPHPLRNVANILVEQGIDPVVAEPLDAHLLSYLTRQRCRTIEFESFWPRLGHYFPLLENDRPMDYVVETGTVDRAWDWIHGGWPGQTPPETKRFLWPRLRRVLNTDPDLVDRREPLADGYERIQLRRPLVDRNLRKKRRAVGK